MRDIARQTILALEESIGEPILWVGAIHDDHAPHLHAHLVAIVPTRLYVPELDMLRQATTDAALEQRHFLDLMQSHERERPYPLQPLPPHTGESATTSPYSRRSPASTGLKYASLGKSSYAKKTGKTATDKCVLAQFAGQSYTRSLHLHLSAMPDSPCIPTVTRYTIAPAGLTLHRQKQLTLTQRRKGAGWER